MRFVRPGSPASVGRLLAVLECAEPTYTEQGASLSNEMPSGFHHLRKTAVLGRGPDVFARASAGIRTWRAHSIPGVRLIPRDPPLEPRTTVVVTLGFGFGAVAAPCRIIKVQEDADRFGFAYGTLPGHPEEGEESFVVSIGNDGVVRFDIRAFSRPGDPITRVAGPMGRSLQSAATQGYLWAMRKFVRQGTSGRTK